MLALLALCYGAFGGADGSSRATYLATNGCGSEAISLAVYEPNGKDMEETYYQQVVEEMEHKQKTWCNQCMWYEEEKGSYDTNFEKEIYEGHGRRKSRNSSCDVSCEEVEVEEKCYKYGGIMNVEGFEVEKDEGMREKSEVFVSLAVMNELYMDFSYGYVVNFVYINFYENLTAEIYTMMMMMSALWIWRMRSTRRKKVRRSHLGCYEKEVVLWVPFARVEKKRQRLQELCLQRKVKMVLWLSMMSSAQAMQEGSPVAAGSQGERVFLERE